MNLGKISLSSLAASLFLGLGWLSLILAIAGIFYGWIVGVFSVLFLIGLAFLIFKRKVEFYLNRQTLFLLVFSFLIVFIFSFYSFPTIFSGRDQGTLSEAAIRLSQNHEIKFSSPASRAFFDIYGPGEALNFPGFYYSNSGELITKFPLGYIAWLASFYSFLGLQGMVIANAVSLIVFLLAFYGVAKLLLKRVDPLLSVFMVATSFFLSWFFKFTLSENLGLALVWLGAFYWLSFLKNQKRIFFLLFIFSFGLLVFIRIEAIAFLVMAFLIISLKLKKSFWKKYGKPSILVLSGMGLIYLVSIFFSSEFYRVIGKGILGFFQGTQGGKGGLNIFQEGFYVLEVFMTYALGNFLILGLVSIIYLIRKKEWDLLSLFFLLVPAFFYLIDPNISDDHPWMLRRFIFAVIPALIIYTLIFLDKIFNKKLYIYLAGAILVATNLMVLLYFISFVPNRILLPQVEKISQNFESNDLVLVDRLATGDPFSMMSGPLSFISGKQAVYFFNPFDLNKIDKSAFSRILLVIPDSNLELYAKAGFGGKLIPLEDYVIYNEIINSNTLPEEPSLFQKINLPVKEKLTVYGKIYLLKK